MVNINNQIIGIIGGMGPQAGAALFNRITCNTHAIKDQDHLSIILASFPRNIVDRTLFLDAETAVNPALHILKVIESLESWGVSVAGIACNTCYSPPIYDVIVEQLNKRNSDITLLHMPYETCSYLKQNFSAAKRIGVMTTNGTYKSGVYKTLLECMSLEVVLPDFKFQSNIIHRIIYDPEIGIKSNPNRITKKARFLINQALKFFKMNNVDAIILGCTELSIALPQQTISGMVIIDSVDVFANALIKEATKSTSM